ncbi:hypothetical protein GR160_12760 [Flavobacterium sp. Sd200]|uniref:lysylphosphatidylglycerol synthase domain-containing protein n=1 Tax=Flavobacterium sp. Sd200 TaxID=2692211 RepID=UPI00136BB7E6|nr:lysylphosphatidylglycerol synthase domain-containing protein [Flavobacterium sp. Sd200]MXN92097.1 hypothetical protein [Flavobacterium sp. Sd200]
MFTLPHKAKQLLVVTAKLLIVGGAFYFIYDRIAQNDGLDWSQLTKVLTGPQSYTIAAVILLLSFLNRFIEIVKWQNLVSPFKKITLGQSTEQVLASLTAGMFTPNGIGEYAAKALYYKKDQAKNIIFLNLVCNGAQLVIAVLAGLIGLLAFNNTYRVVPKTLLIIIIAGIAGLIVVVFASRKIAIRGYSIQKFFENINNLPKNVNRKNLALALCRYLSIMHQHYFIFLLFGITLPYPTMLAAIMGVYFLGSSLPTFQFLDFAVRGSLAVFFFGLMGVNEWIVVFAATLQWLLNIVIPVALGSYYVFKFKTNKI